MSWTATLISTALTVAVVVFCGWRGAQPPNLTRGPRLFPYRLLMLLGIAVLVFMLVHMAGMIGLLPPPRRY